MRQGNEEQTTLADAGWDPVAGGRLRTLIESSPGWRGAAALERDSGVTATTIGSWFKGAPPRIPNILKVAPILGRTPLELYAAWFDEPSSSSGLTRIADEIEALRKVISEAGGDAEQTRVARVAIDAAREDPPGEPADDPPSGPASSVPRRRPVGGTRP